MNAHQYDQIKQIQFDLECFASSLGSDEIDKSIVCHIQCFNDAIDDLLDSDSTEGQAAEDTIMYNLKKIMEE